MELEHLSLHFVTVDAVWPATSRSCRCDALPCWTEFLNCELIEPCYLVCFCWVFCHCSHESIGYAALFRCSPDSCCPQLQSSHDAVYPIEFWELNMPCISQYVEIKSKKSFASMLEVYSGNLRTLWKGNLETVSETILFHHGQRRKEPCVILAGVWWW